MSSAEAAARDDTEVEGNSSSVGLGSAMGQALGASSVPEPQSSRALSQSMGRRAPPPMVAVEEIEEIRRERMPPPQLVRTVICHGNQFETVEEEAADAEIGRL